MVQGSPDSPGEQQGNCHCGGACKRHVDDTTEPDARTLSREELAAFLRQRPTVSVPFAGACFSACRSASYAAAREGSLKVLRLGHQLRVPSAWLERQLGLAEE